MRRENGDVIAMATLDNSKAQAVADRFRVDVERIRGARHLSDEGKAVQLAATYLAARGELEQAKAVVESARTDRRRSLERGLFGMGSNGDAGSAAISYRDAQDRAAQLTTPVEASAVLARAEASGDDMLARAIAAHAFANRWTDLLDDYCSIRPQQVEDEINELYTLQHDSVRTSIVREMEGPRVDRPSELPLDDQAVASLATQGLELSTAS